MILTAISGYSLTKEVRSEQSYLVTVVRLRAFIVKVRGVAEYASNFSEYCAGVDKDIQHDTFFVDFHCPFF